MRTRVFISYTSKDPSITEERLIKLEEKLKPFASVFIDRLHNKIGGQLRVNIELWRCDAMIQLTSDGAQSEWAKKELMTARREGKPVVKISIEELLQKDEEQIFLLLDEIEKKSWSVGFILFVAVLVCVGISFLGIWLSYIFVSKHPDVPDVMNARGLFGDSWGGVNAIISAFAFAGVIVTLFLQNRDLNLQRKEMARQREEFEKENETLKYQRFENLFYNMLNLQQQIVDDLRVEYDADEFSLVPLPTGGQGYENRKAHRVITGRETFRYIFEDESFPTHSKAGDNTKIKGTRRVLYHDGLKAYDDYWTPTIFDHYFRHLYKIIQFVDEQEFPFDEAYRYVSFFRGTLSRHELVWIYYNALQPQYHKLKALVEKYTLLKNLRPELLTLTLEADAYYKGLGITDKDLRDYNFSSRDFEFYLTDEKNDPQRFFLSAFWKLSEIEEGYGELNRWRDFINNASEQVIESKPRVE